MARRNNLSLVPKDDDYLPDRYGSTSSFMAPKNDKTAQRLANILNTGMGRAENGRIVTEKVIGDYTQLWGETMKDYANGHDFATRVTAAYEEAYPESPYDIRHPMADLLSDGANQYRELLRAYGQEAIKVIADSANLTEDDRHWLLRWFIQPLPDE